MSGAMMAARASLLMRSSNVDAAVILTSTDVDVVSRVVRSSFGVVQANRADSARRATAPGTGTGRRDAVQAAEGLANPRERARASIFAARRLFDAAYAGILEGKTPQTPRELRQFTRRSELLQVCIVFRRPPFTTLRGAVCVR